MFTRFTTRTSAGWVKLACWLPCLALLCSPLPGAAGEFTFTTPEGAMFDARTHFYDPERRTVIKRAEFVGLYGQAKRDAYAAVGMRSGPRDPELWKESREAWKQELAGRHHLRVLRAQEMGNRRRGITPNNEDNYYAWITLSDGTRIFLTRQPGSMSDSAQPPPAAMPLPAQLQRVRRPGGA